MSEIAIGRCGEYQEGGCRCATMATAEQIAEVRAAMRISENADTVRPCPNAQFCDGVVTDHEAEYCRRCAQRRRYRKLGTAKQRAAGKFRRGRVSAKRFRPFNFASSAVKKPSPESAR